MRFGRIAAAFIVLALAFSPVRYLVRELFLASAPISQALQRWDGGAIYSVALLLLATGLTIAFALLRLLVRARDTWDRSGLAPLDRGAYGAWPRIAALLAGIWAVGTALWVGAADQIPAVAEAVVATLTVVAAVGGRPPADPTIEDYDPLPIPRLPEPHPVPTPETEPSPPQPGETIPLRLPWYFHRAPGSMSTAPNAYEIQIQASKLRYETLCKQDHSVHSDHDYVRFVRDGMTPEVGDVSWQIRAISQRDQLGTIGEINNVLAFAQRFRYVLDEVDKGQSEYPKFPLETLVDDRGDCEDHAILAAACLINLGYDARLVAVGYGSGPGHMALAVAAAEDLPGAFFLSDANSGQRFYYCEATTDAGSREPNVIAFRMGHAPERDQRARLTLLPCV